MFEVEVSSIEPFRNLVKAVGAVVDEGCLIGFEQGEQPVLRSVELHVRSIIIIYY